MARVLLIENPAAARTEPHVVRTVCRVLEREGWSVDVAGTTRPGDAGRLAAQGVADGVDVIAVYAGDGTTTQAVGGMIGSGIPLALIPGGTGNLLAGNLTLPRDPAKAALLVSRGVRRRIDLGKVDRPGGARYFAVGCGAGLDAQIMAGAPTERKKKWGSFAYITATFNGMYGIKPVAHRVTVDGSARDMEAVLIVVANCGRITSLHFDLGPGIVLDDGWLDLIVIRTDGMAESFVALWELLSGRANGKGRIKRSRGQSITIESERVRPVQADGDLVGETPMKIEVVPGGLEVLVGG